MKKILLCGLFVLLMVCASPVIAQRAVDDSFGSLQGGCIVNTYSIGNVMDNDVQNSNTFTIPEITQQPKNGFVVLDPNGDVVYNANMGFFSGVETFRYRLWDGQSYSNIATVHINVAPYIATPPTRSHYYIAKDTEISSENLGITCPMSFDNILFNSPISHGKISFLQHSGNTPFKYIPNPGFTGWDTFTYMCQYESANEGLCVSKSSEVWIYVGEPPYPAPEFPSTVLPVTMIIGFLGAVLYIQRTKEH